MISIPGIKKLSMREVRTRLQQLNASNPEPAAAPKANRVTEWTTRTQFAEAEKAAVAKHGQALVDRLYAAGEVDTSAKAAMYSRVMTQKMGLLEAVDDFAAQEKGCEEFSGLKPEKPSASVPTQPEVSSRRTVAATPAQPPKPAGPCLQQIGHAVYGEADMERLSRNLGGNDSQIDARLERNLWGDGLVWPGADAAALAAKYSKQPEAHGLDRIRRAERQRKIDSLSKPDSGQADYKTAWADPLSSTLKGRDLAAAAFDQQLSAKGYKTAWSRNFFNK